MSDTTGSVKIEIINQKPLKQEMLESEDCFILDTGSGIYVWLGKKATKREKDEAVLKAKNVRMF